MTRRDLLLGAVRLGLATGLAESLGLAAESVHTDLGLLDPIGPGGPEVLILGAGIAGMCAAYELEALGYRCRILEARHRSGGRCVTIRHGDRVEESGERQICQYEHGHYFNPGPTRVPHWQITVDYCRKFGVALAPWINVNENAYILQTKGKLANRLLRIRDVIADTEGHMGQFLFDSIKRGATGADWSAADRDLALSFISAYAFIDKDGVYRGTYRRSFKDFDPVSPTGLKHEEPIDMLSLFAGGLGGSFKFINAIDQQMSMLEIVGGVDRLAKAFEKSLRARIEFGCEVTEINTSPSETVVAFRDRTGKRRTARAPFCICTIPLSVLKKIPANFTGATAEAIKSAFYVPVTKVGAEFSSRFWEHDDRIYGGISWTDQPIRQIIYPSSGFHSRSGILVNYTGGFDSLAFSSMPPAKRIGAAVAQMSKIHPQASSNLKSAVTLAWEKVPYSNGAFAIWDITPNGDQHYKLMLEPQASLYFAGEHCSQLTAWMAGAIESARYVVKKIHERAAVGAAI